MLALNYIKSWFLPDLIAAFPFQLFETSLINMNEGTDSDSFEVAKIARIPRIYRIVRILRLIKLFRLTKKNNTVGGFLNRILNLDSAAANILKLGFMVLFLTHLAACLWFLQAKWSNLQEDSWVVQEKMVTAPIGGQYTLAFYWALQTLTTVGFGDISIKSVRGRFSK